MIQTNDGIMVQMTYSRGHHHPRPIILCGMWARTGSEQSGQLEFLTFLPKSTVSFRSGPLTFTDGQCVSTVVDIKKKGLRALTFSQLFS